MRSVIFIAVALFTTVSYATPPNTTQVALRHTSAPDGTPQVNVAVSDAALASLGAERIKDYEAFTVARVPRTRLDTLTDTALQQGLEATIHEEWDRIHTPNRIIDTREDLPALLDTPTGLYLVQFIGPSTPEWEGALNEAGFVYISYLPYNAAIIFGTRSAAEQIRLSPFVQWVSVYEGNLKAAPSLLSPVATRRYTVQVADVPGNEATVYAVLQANQGELDETTYGPYLNLTVTLTSAYAVTLTMDAFIVGVEEHGIYLTSGEREAIALTGTFPSFSGETYQSLVRPYKSTSDYRTWLSNRGVLETGTHRIAIADTGLDGGRGAVNHPDLRRTDILFQTFASGDTGNDIDGHGTAVTGMAVGNPYYNSLESRWPYDPDNFWFGMGVAPKTGIIAQKIFRRDGAGNFALSGNQMTWLYNAKYPASGYGAVVQSQSRNEYNPPEQRAYRMEDQLYDQSIWDYNLPVTVSAGNIRDIDGNVVTVLTPALAKNVITVGGAEGYRPNLITSCTPASWYIANSFKNVSGVSRRGTLDGRIKPEVIAPASLISTARYSAVTRTWCNVPDPAYLISSGTSFASPQVAAAVVLLNKKLRQPYAPLSAAMAKAAIVGTAISVKGGSDGRSGTVAARPNPVQGFGRLQLDGALRNSPVHTYLDEGALAPFTGTGQVRSRNFTVADTSKPVVIVIAWTDYASAAGVSPALTRDLNLEVWGGCSTQYWGNQINPTTEYSRSGSGCYGPRYSADMLNNVEMIVLPPNHGPSFSAVVFSKTGGNWASANRTNQPFALFVSNAF